jgi:hypothetical protein
MERYVRTVEEHLRKFVVLHKRNWDARQPIFLHAYRVFTHDTAGLTAANLIFGRELRLPSDQLFGVSSNKE